MRGEVCGHIISMDNLDNLPKRIRNHVIQILNMF